MYNPKHKELFFSFFFTPFQQFAQRCKNKINRCKHAHKNEKSWTEYYTTCNNNIQNVWCFGILSNIYKIKFSIKFNFLLQTNANTPCTACSTLWAQRTIYIRAGAGQTAAQAREVGYIGETETRISRLQYTVRQCGVPTPRGWLSPGVGGGSPVRKRGREE